jgi:hypothetical protein
LQYANESQFNQQYLSLALLPYKDLTSAWFQWMDLIQISFFLKLSHLSRAIYMYNESYALVIQNFIWSQYYLIQVRENLGFNSLFLFQCCLKLSYHNTILVSTLTVHNNFSIPKICDSCKGFFMSLPVNLVSTL